MLKSTLPAPSDAVDLFLLSPEHGLYGGPEAPGRGVKAVAAISKGDIIAYYAGVKRHYLEGGDNTYAFDVDKYNVIDGLWQGNITRYLNSPGKGGSCFF